MQTDANGVQLSRIRDVKAAFVTEEGISYSKIRPRKKAFPIIDDV